MANGSATARSPLSERLPMRLPQLVVSEVPLGSLVQVACWPGGADALDAALARENVPGLPEPLHSASRGGVTIMNVGPDRALVSAPRTDLYASLSNSVPAEVGTITDLGHARVAIRLEGARSRWVLSKGVAVDLGPAAFPTGRTILTEIGHIGVVLRCVEAQSYDLYPYRGYAAALADWLALAGAADGREAA